MTRVISVLRYERQFLYLTLVILSLWAFISALIPVVLADSSIGTTDLRVDRRENGLFNPRDYLHRTLGQNTSVLQGVENPWPRFSWVVRSSNNERAVMQSRYRLVIAKISPRGPQFNSLWCDSGIVESSASLHVQCANESFNNDHIEPLESDTTYEWSVQVWDRNGRASDPEMATARFHTAFVAPNQFSGVWIGSMNFPMNELRREFTVSKPIASASVFICGLGYYQLYFNGLNVDQTRKLDPAWTTFQKRVLYASYDVTFFLKQGSNAVGIQLGNGWYSQQQYMPPSMQEPSYGPPRVVMQLNITHTDGTKTTIVTDASSGWYGRSGPIVLDSVYDGEKYDARLDRPGWNNVGFHDNATLWIPASIMPGPGGVMTSQLLEPIRTHEEIRPKKIWSPSMNGQVVDFGQNFVGWVRVKFTNMSRGLAVQLRHAEVLETQVPSSIYSQTIYVDNLRSAAATDIYIFKGGASEIYEPRFTVHGFQYVLLSALPNLGLNDIVGIVVNSAVKKSGNIYFPTQPILNGVQHLVVWGQRSNMMSLPTDCPQRDERKGWMGDAGLTVDESMFNYDGNLFYEKFLRDIADIQDAEGTITDTVPHTFGSRPADPSWGTAFPTILYYHYNHYGDASIVAQYYPAVRAWIDYLSSRVNTSGLAKMYVYYGDWVPPPPQTATSGSLCSAFSYLNDVNNLATMAAVIGNSADNMKYSALYQSLAVKFHQAFYNASIGGYADGKQTANALALYLPGVVPDNLKSVVANNLLNDIIKANNYHLTTGIIGARFLMLTLSQVLNRTDVALRLASQTSYPSWGYMFANTIEPASTLWELWDSPNEGPGMDSRNHIMFGSIGAWFYRILAGIDPNGLDTILIHPRVSGISPQLKHVQANYNTHKGNISVEWTWTVQETADGPAKFALEVGIPSNTRAKVHLPLTDTIHGPAKYLFEGTTMLWSAEEGLRSDAGVLGIEELRVLAHDDLFVVHTLPGNYRFSAVYIQ